MRDRWSGTTERVSVDSGGVEANWDSFQPSLSADGRCVAFSSAASNLVPGDTNARTDVFVHDRWTATTERVSVSSAGAQGDDGSYTASISGDGRHVAFHSYDRRFVPRDTEGYLDIFVHDRSSGTTERVSVSSSGAQGDEDSYFPSISADGHHVAFYSYAPDLVPGDTNGYPDIFVRAR